MNDPFDDLEFPFFSVITVCLNAGEDLVSTAKTVLGQTFASIEYIVKDGISQDGSIDQLPKDPRLKLIVQPDKSIYDAMNQAIPFCRGRYIVFMNAGDGFSTSHVLQQVAESARQNEKPDILYTNFYNQKYELEIIYPRQLSRRYLFRNVPCHQAIYTRRDSFEKTGHFDGKGFPVLADNQLFMELILRKNGRAIAVPIIGCYYKDGGFYTKPGFFTKREKERDLLRRRYFSVWEYLIWGLVYKSTFPGLRGRLQMLLPKGPLRSAYFRFAREINRLGIFGK